MTGPLGAPLELVQSLMAPLEVLQPLVLGTIDVVVVVVGAGNPSSSWILDRA